MYSIASYRLSLDKKAEALNSEDFFLSKSEEALFRHRHAIERGLEHFYCACCAEELKISGGGETKQRLHFRHKKQDVDRECGYSDDQYPTRREIEAGKYGNKEEGLLHRSIKNTIASVLENTGYDVYVERLIKNEKEPKHPRQPDIRAISIERDIDMAVEIQLTTTFLDTIIGRNEFYRNRHMFIFWVFYNVKNNFTQKDITYDSYYQNIFVFDDEVQQLTRTENQLYFKCFYNKYYCDPTNGDINKESEFTSEIVAFEDLHFDREKCEIYYYNPFEAQEQLKIEQKTIKEELEEQRRIAQIEEIRREEKKRAEEEERRKKREEEQRIREAQWAEEQRKRDLKKGVKDRLDDYIYRDKISVEDLWKQYLQLNDEEKKYMDEAIHDIIYIGVTRSFPYESIYYKKYVDDNTINNLFIFLYKQKYPYDLKRFESVPNLYFQRPHSLNLMLCQNIIVLLYLTTDFELPNKKRYLEQIQKEFNEIIQETQGTIDYPPHNAQELNDLSLLIMCFERLRSSRLRLCQENYYWVYNHIEVIRHLYSVYLGETIGRDYTHNYYTFYDKLASSYYPFYKRMVESRKKVIQGHGLLRDMSCSLDYIENKLNSQQIKPKYEKADVERMSVLFPDIQWELQPTLFE